MADDPSLTARRRFSPSFVPSLRSVSPSGEKQFRGSLFSFPFFQTFRSHIIDKRTISIANEVFSEDVAKRLGVKRTKGSLSTDIRYSPAEPQRRVVTRAQMPKPGITEKITNAKGQLNRRGLKNALDNASSAWESFKIVTVNAQQELENQLIRGGMTKRQAAAWSQLARSGRLHANNAIGYALADMTGEVRSEGLMKIIEPFLATKEIEVFL